MTHFAAIALFACSAAVDEAFRRKPRTREKQSWHPSQVRLWVVLIITYRQTSEMVGRKPLIVWEFRNISRPGLNDPNFNPGESKRCIESSTLGIGYLLLVLRLKR